MAKSIHIRNFTHELGRAQGYVPLEVRREVQRLDDGSSLPITSTAWELSPEELVSLQAGEPLIISIIGHQWPPMLVSVGDPSDADKG